MTLVPLGQVMETVGLMVSGVGGVEVPPYSTSARVVPIFAFVKYAICVVVA